MRAGQGDGMKNSFRKLFDFNSYERECWVKEQAAKINPASLVLDAGAGSCPYRQYFKHCDYRTQDLALLPGEQLEGMKGYGKLDYISDIRALPVPSASFDAILCTEVLEHVPEPIKAVQEFARVLKPKGTLLLTVPLGSGLHQEPYHYYGGFTPHWFNKYLIEAGFCIDEISPNGGFFKHFGQECRRFSTILAPSSNKKSAHWYVIPFWIISFPIFNVIMPVLGYILDGLDQEKSFTVGYFIKARKK